MYAPGHYFQTTSALNEEARKATKSKNTKGSPIKLPSKILAVIPDLQDQDAVYIAEAAGNIKRVNVKVEQPSFCNLLWPGRTPHISRCLAYIGYTICWVLGQVSMVVERILAKA